MNLFKTIIALACLILLTGSIHAQNSEPTPVRAPEPMNARRLEAIRKEVQNEKSPRYYPKLLERFNAGDTNLNLEDLNHLYYGYTVQPAYRPYAQNPELDALGEFIFQEKVPPMDQIEKKAAPLLEAEPVDLKALAFMIVAERSNGITDGKHALKYFQIVDVIRASGDGKSLDSRMYVIRVSDEYMLLTTFGLRLMGQALIDRTDKMTVDPTNDMGITELYFDISLPYAELGKTLKGDLPKATSKKKRAAKN